MQYVRSTSFIAVAALSGLMFGAPVGAQTSDDKTIVTISGPVHLPGRTLAAGKYVFKLHDSASTRHIVQVMSADGTQMITQLLAIPAERQQVTGDTVITFAERASSRPPAVRYWFYPGKSIGHEFVYSKEEAMEIARASNETVQYTTSATSSVEEMRTAEISKVDPSEAQAAASQPPAAPVAPAPMGTETPASTASASASQRANQQSASQTASASQGMNQQSASQTAQASELPRTASPLPLAAAIGLLSFGGALAARAFRRKVA